MLVWSCRWWSISCLFKRKVSWDLFILFLMCLFYEVGLDIWQVFFFLMNGYLNLILCWIFINVYLKCKSKIELKKNRNVNPVISNLCLYDVEQEDACNVNYYATWTP